jgi:hypothetical protein
LGKPVVTECPATYSLQKKLTSYNPAYVDGQVTFEIIVTNTDPRRSIVRLPLIDSFDNEFFEFASAEPPPNQVSQETGLLSWDDLTESLGDIPPGGQISVSVRFKAIKVTGAAVAVNRAKTQDGRDSAGYRLPPLESSAWVPIRVKRVFVTVTEPGSRWICEDGIVEFQASAFDGSVGGKNGDGIESVLFQVKDSNGQLVYERSDSSAPFCGFGGDSSCHSLPATAGKWTSIDNDHSVEGPLHIGQTYTFHVTAHGQEGRTAEGMRTLSIDWCYATPTRESTETTTPSPTPSQTPTPTFTPSPTFTPTMTPTPLPTGRPYGSILDNFGCDQVAAFCKLDSWIDADAASTLAQEPATIPGVEASWHAVFPRNRGTKWLETAVDMPTWFWAGDGYEDFGYAANGTIIQWQDLGPIAWCLGDGDEPAFSVGDGYAFELPLSAVEDVDATIDPMRLPLPKFEYSSLGQSHRLDIGPYRGVSAFETQIVSTWWLSGTVRDEDGNPVAVDAEVPVCDTVSVWVRQPQSILVLPDDVPDWLGKAGR